MPRPAASRLRTVRAGLGILAGLALGYVAVMAAWPGLRSGLPPAISWFGRPNSAVTIAIVSVLVLLFAIAQSRAGAATGAPVAIVAALALITAILGVASYWRCKDDSHPNVFTPLIWTAQLVKGGNPAQALDSGTCPSPMPVALNIAQLSALAAVFLSVIGVAVALFQSRLDRLRTYLAASVTVVVDPDEDGQSMLAAIARTLDRRSVLVVITSDPDRPCIREARAKNARIVTVDFSRAETLTSLPIWNHLDRLYLLSPDASANLSRLHLISERTAKSDTRQRLPLIVRIDDPWQAAAWRAQHFGGTRTRWAADAVGKYEVTARRLLDQIIADSSIDHVIVAGASQLSLALCSDMAQRQLERDYYTAPGERQLPRLTLIAESSEEVKLDHEFACRQRGLPSARPELNAVAGNPSTSVLIGQISDSGPTATAVILVDSNLTRVENNIGTRLAARYPATPIYAWDPNAEAHDDRPAVVGQLRTYRLSMDVPPEYAQDRWERAAQLIHDSYAAQSDQATPATRPWADLDEFYRGSNRRQVHNALWMVEKIGGHTWNTFGTPPDSISIGELREIPALEQLALMGFGHDVALAMARAEHEDWCRYYRARGWKFGQVRDDTRKIHDKLVDWPTVEADPDLLNSALNSLATTLLQLRQLGYRSRPTQDALGWRRFRRVGTVVAEQRPEAWSWKTQSGHTMHAAAGDWAVREPDGSKWWSVGDHVFRARHEHVEGSRWRRTGSVRARPARDGEAIDTPEGPTTASTGDWVVQGDDGDVWPVPGDEFGRRYEPLSPG